MSPLRFALYAAAVVAAAVATVLAFRWFGTDDAADWPGWFSGAFLLYLLAGFPASGWPRRSAGTVPA